MKYERIAHAIGVLGAAAVAVAGEIDSNPHASWLAIVVALVTRLDVLLGPKKASEDPKP